MNIALIILAAGKGTRMESDLPKVLHKIAGAPMLAHVIKAGNSLEPEKVVVVAGHGAELVTKAAQDYDPEATIVLQEEQLGTGHAAMQAREALAGFEGDAIVMFGDTPFISQDTLERMAEARAKHDVVVLGFNAADPAKYGRLVTEGDTLLRIVEFKDASDEERAITLCNSGVLCASAPMLFDLLDQVNNDNASGEYYLPDIVGIARDKGMSATAVTCDEAETLGINSRAELAVAEKIFQTKARADLIEDGVYIQAPDTVYLSFDTVIGRDAEIEPNVVFGPGVTIESNAQIRAFSHLEGCHVSRGSVVGPYARLRPGAELAEDVRIGNFVEVKNAQIDEGAKVNHLSYIGDAHVGAGSNIGAGTITCNYDGREKHPTTIGDRVFIGSGTELIAPVTLGDDAYVAAGSCITNDVPAGALGVARARQVNKEDWVTRRKADRNTSLPDV